MSTVSCLSRSPSLRHSVVLCFSLAASPRQSPIFRRQTSCSFHVGPRRDHDDVTSQQGLLLIPRALTAVPGPPAVFCLAHQPAGKASVTCATDCESVSPRADSSLITSSSSCEVFWFRSSSSELSSCSNSKSASSIFFVVGGDFSLRQPLATCPQG